MSRNLLESGDRGNIRGKNVQRRKCREGLVQRQEKESLKKIKNGQQGMPVIPAIWALRQEDHEFEAA